MIAIALALTLLQTAPPPSGEATARTWSGCVQQGSAPSTYRLNLDRDTARSGETANPTGAAQRSGSSGTQNPTGEPFVHLVSESTELDLTRHVGRRVRVTGRELSREEAEKEAAKRPNRQEAAETAAGTGGESPRHIRYVRVQRIEQVSGSCEQR